MLRKGLQTIIALIRILITAIEWLTKWREGAFHSDLICATFSIG